MTTQDAFATAATRPIAAVRAPWYQRRAATACAAGGLALATALAIGLPIAAFSTGAAATTTASARDGAAASSDATSSWTQTVPDQGFGGFDTSGNGAPGGTEPQQGTTGTTGQESATEASAEESTGVAIINTDLAYYGSEAAGTGMVLTSDGLILTNNHVIEGATTIEVTIPSTGETYTATLVGSDAEDDVAVLQLDGASGLDTVTIDEDDESVGDAVTAVGNADGEGVLMAADGSITALESTVTTQAEGVVDAETLDGMIEISADVVSGDSGGALLDSDGEVIGMNTAASSGTSVVTAYAIPIEDALGIVLQIVDGDESDGVTIGYSAFLGVYFGETTSATEPGTQTGAQTGTTASSGATVAGVLEDTPAADAGLVAGDTITAVDGTAVATSDELSALLEDYEPGDTVTVAYTDASGTAQTASITLTEGPA